MTDDKRFWAACAAMQGILSYSVECSFEGCAQDSVGYADALLTALAPAAEPGEPIQITAEDVRNSTEPHPVDAAFARLTAERDELKAEVERWKKSAVSNADVIDSLANGISRHSLHPKYVMDALTFYRERCWDLKNATVRLRGCVPAPTPAAEQAK